jgi:hypothetical protein
VRISVVSNPSTESTYPADFEILESPPRKNIKITTRLFWIIEPDLICRETKKPKNRTWDATQDFWAETHRTCVCKPVVWTRWQTKHGPCAVDFGATQKDHVAISWCFEIFKAVLICRE